MGEAEGLWIRAERQRAGRGRQGRSWFSDPDNLSASTLIRLLPSDPPAPTLALVAAIALHVALSVVAPDVEIRIKWPNDVMAGGAKLSGILLERQGDGVAIGFGVNLAAAPDLPDRPATSMRALTGTALEPGGFVALLADSFACWVGIWRSEGLAPVRTAWLKRAHSVGTALRVRGGVDGAAIDGLFAGLDPAGGLLLRAAEGVRTVHAGDVFLL